MEETQSAVALSERPAHQPASTAPFPPPSLPPVYPPGDWFTPTPAQPPRRRRIRAAIVAVAALIAGAVVAGVVDSQGSGGSSTATTVSSPSTTSAAETLPTVAAAAPTNSTTLTTKAIAALVDPAVVDITTKIAGGEAAGTGMVLTSTGLVLTNNHVIDGAESISVQIGGSGPSYTAHVVGYDVADDIALIKIDDISGLTTITVGDSTNVSVGDRVVTIGNALGSAGPHAVSSGTIDALDQSITANDLTGDSENLTGLIQIGATLQPGDSGGPLVSSSGQVIGVNTAASVSGRRITSSTSGYAIPIDEALAIAQRIENGESSATIHIGDRAVLGVQVVSSRSFSQVGAQVDAVNAGSPAAKAGMERGAIITAIDDATIGSIDELQSALFPRNPGDSVKVTWTDAAGTSHTATVQLIAGPPA